MSMGHVVRVIRRCLPAALLVALSPLAAPAATIPVACPPGSLGTFTLQGFAPGDVLLVSGTCTVNLVIPAEISGVTLDGQGTATIAAADSTQATITIRGASITVKGFTITGGLAGISVTSSGTATIDGNVIQSSTLDGIDVIRGATATIINNTVQNNTDFGIAVSEGANARIGFVLSTDATASPNRIQNNPRGGIVVTRSSAARIVGNTIQNNGNATTLADGILVIEVSQADISSNLINGNARHGINVGNNSGVNLGRDTGTGILDAPNTTTTPNTLFGINCFTNSYADGRLGSLNGTSGAKSFAGSCSDSLIP